MKTENIVLLGALGVAGLLAYDQYRKSLAAVTTTTTAATSAANAATGLINDVANAPDNAANAAAALLAQVQAALAALLGTTTTEPSTGAVSDVWGRISAFQKSMDTYTLGATTPFQLTAAPSGTYGPDTTQQPDTIWSTIRTAVDTITKPEEVATSPLGAISAALAAVSAGNAALAITPQAAPSDTPSDIIYIPATRIGPDMAIIPTAAPGYSTVVNTTSGSVIEYFHSTPVVSSPVISIGGYAPVYHATPGSSAGPGYWASS